MRGSRTATASGSPSHAPSSSATRSPISESRAIHTRRSVRRRGRAPRPGTTSRRGGRRPARRGGHAACGSRASRGAPEAIRMARSPPGAAAAQRGRAGDGPRRANAAWAGRGAERLTSGGLDLGVDLGDVEVHRRLGRRPGVALGELLRDALGDPPLARGPAAHRWTAHSPLPDPRQADASPAGPRPADAVRAGRTLDLARRGDAARIGRDGARTC